MALTKLLAHMVSFLPAWSGAVKRSVKDKLQDTVSIKDFGFVGDWNGTTGTNNTPMLLAMLANTNITKIVGAPGKYWFGNIPGDTALATIARKLEIDWNGAELFVGETNPTAANTGTVFLLVKDTGGFKMGNYEFTDTTFAYTNASRGIQPVSILNTGTNVTYGYELYNFYVRKGQSLLTAYSNNPGVAIAKSIRFSGVCRGGSVYYGANLAYSGDDCSGTYTLDNCHRAVFLYDVEDVDLVVHAKNSEPSSANVLISGNGTRTTRNINVKVTLDVVNGGVLVAGSTTTANPASFENVELDVFAKTAGPNAGTSGTLVRIGVQDAAGNWTASSSYTLNNVNVRVRSAFKYSLGLVGVCTQGVNVGCIGVDANHFLPWAMSGDFRNASVHFGRPGGRVVVGGSGNLQTAGVKLNLLKFIPIGPKNVFGTLRVGCFLSDSSYTVREYRLSGFLASDGSHTPSALNAVQVNSATVGAHNPTITITSDWTAYIVGASAGGDAGAYTVVDFIFNDGSA